MRVKGYDMVMTSIVRHVATGGFLAAAGGFLAYLVIPAHTTPVNRYAFWVAIVGSAVLAVSVVVGVVIEVAAAASRRRERGRPGEG